MNTTDENYGQTPQPAETTQPGSFASNMKSETEEAKESRVARERERLRWEEEERQRKIEEREKAEKERLEAERRALYAELENVDYDLLALLDYPTDHEIYAAKRSRTLWFIALGSALFLFLASLLSLTSPWVGGIAGGLAFVLWLTHGAGMMAYFPSLNRYPQLVMQRKRLKRNLIEYIRNLEGRQGFIHRIYPLAQHNARLGARRFKRLALMSREHTLLANLKTLQDTRAYHEFMVEALRGYKELLQKEKEDAFVQSMDFDPDLLEEQATPETASTQAAAHTAPAEPDPSAAQATPTARPAAQSVEDILNKSS
ncbi:hypothetical protein V6U78_04150 [Marinospirillum sp. MEB164]|uniref:Uncharacterized protein n=1 Tax=Marinospirillum alkalitolerans TaxID=3123374 RepID=A0ABW8PVB8_9GAMM